MDNRVEIILAAKDVTGKAFTKVSSQVANLTKSVFSLNGALVTVAGASAMGLMVQRSIEVTAELKKNADMAGVTVEAYQELDYVARQHQITVDAMTDGLKELSLRTDEFVVTGAGPAKEAFERLGYSQEQLNSMLSDTPALLQDVIWRMEGLGQAAKIRIADELFGGSGGEQFVSMIKAGARSFSDLRREAHELGIVLDEDIVENSVEAKKKIDALTKVLTANFQGVVAQLAPDIAEIAGDMSDWVKANQEFIRSDVTKAMKDIADAVSDIADFAVPAAWGVGQILKITSNAVPGVGFVKALKAYRDFKKEIESNGQVPGTIISKPINSSTPGYDDYVKSSQNNGYGLLPAIDYSKDYLTDHEKRMQQNSDEILAASGDAIRAMEELRRKSLERQSEMQKQFQSEYDAIMLSSFELERKYLADQVARWEKQGMDRVMIKEAESKKLAEIAERETAELEARTKDALDGFFSEIEALEAGTSDVVVDHLKSIEDAARGVFKGMEDQLVEFFTTGQASVEDFVSSVLKDLARLAIQESITKPLSGWVGSLFGSAHGNVVSGISAFSNQVVSTPTIVPGASRVTPYATGGALFGEAGPEGILPLKRMPSGNLGVESSGNSSSVVINVVDQRTSDSPAVEVSEAQGPDGKTQFLVLIREEVRGAFDDGSMDKSMRTNYGLQRAGIRR